MDDGMVNENVGSAIIGGDETEALIDAEPLHCAFSHCAFSYRDDRRDPRARAPGCCDRLSSKAKAANPRRRCKNSRPGLCGPKHHRPFVIIEILFYERTVVSLPQRWL